MTLKVKHIRDFKSIDQSAWTSIPENKISAVNWTEFPYQPEVSFRIVHNGEMLFIHYDITEDYTVRADNEKDQDPVYQDSCVEFFILDDQDIYHNFEFNAKGIALSAMGKERNHRISRNTTEMEQIIRHTSGISKKGNQYHWTLTVGIPFASMGLARGFSYRANFYKCGDLTEKKHYLSWNEINTQKPDFHCPKHFGLIEIE